MSVLDSIGDLETSRVIFNSESAKLKNMDNLSNTEFKDQINLSKKAKELEHVFVNKMFGIVFENINLDPFAENNTAYEIYRSMMVECLTKELCKTNNLGIAQMVTKQLTNKKDNNESKEGVKKYDPGIN